MLRVVALALIALLVGAAPASAAVLVEAIPRTLVCGDGIRPGIWAQSWTTGDRTVRMQAIDRLSGRVWWRKTAVASKRGWRHWTLPSGMDGQCTRTTFVYSGRGWKARYDVSFAAEGA
jgi:hypothetical protein